MGAYAGLGIMVSTEHTKQLPDGEVDNGNFKRIQLILFLLIVIVAVMFYMKDFTNFDEVGVSLAGATSAALADKKLNERYRNSRTTKKRT